MTDEELENEMTRTYGLGIISGIEQASNKVFDMSVDLFKRNKDNKAIEMKDISKILLGMSLDRQIKHKKEYPKD